MWCGARDLYFSCDSCKLGVWVSLYQLRKTQWRLFWNFPCTEVVVLLPEAKLSINCCSGEIVRGWPGACPEVWVEPMVHAWSQRSCWSLLWSQGSPPCSATQHANKICWLGISDSIHPGDRDVPISPSRSDSLAYGVVLTAVTDPLTLYAVDVSTLQLLYLVLPSV